MPCYLLALLLGTFLGVRAQTIHQRPLARVQLVGSLFSLECTVQGASSPYLYWYRQSLGGAPQLLFSSQKGAEKRMVTKDTPETRKKLRTRVYYAPLNLQRKI